MIIDHQLDRLGCSNCSFAWSLAKYLVEHAMRSMTSWCSICMLVYKAAHCLHRVKLKRQDVSHQFCGFLPSSACTVTQGYQALQLEKCCWSFAPNFYLICLQNFWRRHQSHSRTWKAPHEPQVVLHFWAYKDNGQKSLSESTPPWYTKMLHGNKHTSMNSVFLVQFGPTAQFTWASDQRSIYSRNLGSKSHLLTAV